MTKESVLLTYHKKDKASETKAYLKIEQTFFSYLSNLVAYHAPSIAATATEKPKVN